MSEGTRKDDEIHSLNDEIDIDQINPDALEDASGGTPCIGCHGFYAPNPPALDEARPIFATRLAYDDEPTGSSLAISTAAGCSRSRELCVS